MIWPRAVAGIHTPKQLVRELMILIHQPTFTGTVLTRYNERRRLQDVSFVNTCELDAARAPLELTQFREIFGSRFQTIPTRMSPRKEE